MWMVGVRIKGRDGYKVVKDDLRRFNGWVFVDDNR